MLYMPKPGTIRAEQWFPEHPVKGVLLLPKNSSFDEPVGMIEIDREHYFVLPGDYIVTLPDGTKLHVPRAAFEQLYAPQGEHPVDDILKEIA